METTYLIQRQFHQLQIGERNFHLSHVLFELSDVKDGATGEGQKIKFTKIQKNLWFFFKQNRIFQNYSNLQMFNCNFVNLKNLS